MRRRGQPPEAGRIELGLAVSALSLKLGEERTQRQLAYFCDCDHKTIQNIERKALEKARFKLRQIIREEGILV